MLWSGVLFTKFGSHRAFLRQIDPWMTFDPRWGHFENMPTNLVGPPPTPMPTFSSITRSTTKRIAGQTYIHTYRLNYFSIDFGALTLAITKCHNDQLRCSFLVDGHICSQLKEPSPIFSIFFQTFGDFAITRKLIFFS